MKRIILPAIAVVAILLIAGGAAFALTGGSDDEPGAGTPEVARDGTSGDEDAGDPSGGGTVAGMCVEGVPDCVDMVVNPDGEVADPESPPDEPVSSDDPGTAPNSGDLVDPGECSLTHNIDVCQEKAVALVTEKLARRTKAEFILVSVEYVEWPDASLGNPQPGIAYAEVITPGYKIILEAAGTQYEYHTDLGGNFTLLD